MIDELKFDPTKPVQLRDGTPARIICRDVKNLYPIVAVIERSNGIESISTHMENGNRYLGRECELDLINVPEKQVFYLNVYADAEEATGIRTGRNHASQKEADRSILNEKRIACVKVEFTAGQFDE